MPAVKPTEAELAARALAATKVLKKLLAAGAKAEVEAENRSTGSRTKYKAGHAAAEEALRILNGRPALDKPKAANSPAKVPTRSRRAVVDPVPARRVRGSAAAKSNVVPIGKAPSSPKKSTVRKVGGRRG